MKLFLCFFLALAFSSCAMSPPVVPEDAGIRFTSQGVNAEVPAAPDQVAATSENVLRSMGIRPTGSNAADDGGHVVTGKGRVDHVTIRIEGSGSASHVEVLDYTGNGNWDQDFAAIILFQIKGTG